jgi:hypothetical protein
MVVDLTAASGTRHIVLGDPGHTAHLQSIAEDALDPRILRLAETGQVLILHVPKGDCELTIRVFVDDTPPSALQKAGGRSPLGPVRLELPSGQLEAVGAEDVAKPHEERDPDTFGSAHVGTGTFSGSAFHTVRWKLRNRRRYVECRTTPLGRRLRSLQNVAGLVGAVLMVGHLIGLGPFVGLAFWLGGRRVGAIAVVGLVIFDVAAWIFYYLLDRAVRTRPVFSEAQKIEEQFEDEFPDVVVSLGTGPQSGPPVPGVLVVN